jgi:hypothetical protein
VEEFDGRRRCGNVIIPEGRVGQGWNQFLLELHKAIDSLFGVKNGKKEKEVKVRRSYAGVMALKVNPSKECFGSHPESLARVPLSSSFFGFWFPPPPPPPPTPNFRYITMCSLTSK